MSTNVLPNAAIVGGVLAVLQLAKSLAPQMATWPNNLIRAMGFALAYAMVVVNALVAHPLHWQELWGLLPLAAALSGTATLAYHLATDAAVVSRQSSVVSRQPQVQSTSAQVSPAAADAEEEALRP